MKKKPKLTIWAPEKPILIRASVDEYTVKLRGSHPIYGIAQSIALDATPDQLAIIMRHGSWTLRADGIDWAQGSLTGLPAVAFPRVGGTGKSFSMRDPNGAPLRLRGPLFVIRFSNASWQPEKWAEFKGQVQYWPLLCVELK